MRSERDADLSWFAVGDYKRRANMIGGKETSKPSESFPGRMVIIISRGTPPLTLSPA